MKRETPDYSVREYRENDLLAIERMWERQEIGYAKPDFSHPRFALKLVLENRDGLIDMAFGARMTTEIFMLMRPEVRAQWDAWARFKELHREGEKRLYGMGFEDVHCWLPPEKVVPRIGRVMARRLRSLGWKRDDEWMPHVKYLKASP